MRKLFYKLGKTSRTLIIIISLIIIPFIISSFNLESCIRNGKEGKYPETSEPEPVLFFEPPTPANNTNLINKNWAGINVSISEENLSTFRFGWNEEDYDIYGDNLVLGMNLDENTNLGENSTFAHDFSKNQNHGTLLSGAQWSTGKYGKGLSFDGSDAYMDCGTKDSFISTRGTIQFWFKATTFYERLDIINIYENDYQDFLLICRTVENRICLRIEDDDIGVTEVKTIRTISDTDFHHVIVTQDGSGIRIFIDGKVEELEIYANSGYWTNHLTSARCWIGKGHWTHFKGMIDEVMIYSEAIEFLNSIDEKNYDGYGADVNPTGNPIGGGTGYKDIINSADADHFVTNKAELLAALAIATSGEIVYIDDSAEINMTGTEDTVIPVGVTLASGRGNSGSEGALLHYDTKNLWAPYFTYGYCQPSDNVRITGLRIQGPHNGTDESDDSCAIYTHDVSNVEIDNCELYAWGYTPAYFLRTSGGHVHHNYIHHNQRSGLGYGVIMGQDAYTLIEANLMDFCRHHIAGSGNPGCGYEARYNVVLENDGESHCFDMHGARDFEKRYRVSHWRFDEGSGPSAADSAISIYNNANDGTLTNMDADTCWVNGKIKNGLRFDGINDHVNCNDDTTLGITAEITIEAWIKTSVNPEDNNQVILSKGTFSSSQAYSLYLNGDDDKIYFCIDDGVNVSWAMPAGLQDNWHHVLGTFDGNKLRLYYDGLQKASKEHAGSIGTNSRDLCIGATSSGTLPFNGIIDEVLVYDRALDNDTIYLHHEGFTDIAGDSIKIHHNTFKVNTEKSVQIRGISHYTSEIYRNVFYHDNPEQAVAQTNAFGNLDIYDNYYFRQRNHLKDIRFKKHDSTRWGFFFNATDLSAGIYTYYGWANDTDGNEGYTHGSIDGYCYDSVNPRYLIIVSEEIPDSKDLQIILLIIISIAFIGIIASIKKMKTTKKLEKVRVKKNKKANQEI